MLENNLLPEATRASAKPLSWRLPKKARMWSSPAAALPGERSSPRRLLRAVEAPCSCERMLPERMTSSRSSKRPSAPSAHCIAFNNAGTEGQFGLLTTEQTVEHYHQVCDINIRGVLLSMKHEIPAMLRSGGG